ncbi:hypothetical protein GCM10022421_02960 [Oceanisphaera sediminis]|uniref:Uncharacterized protein n=1 Tax=Oceanisphaera sediminis TaxID=981381 RepID=A0ABP7D6H6_9GAMM
MQRQPGWLALLLVLIVIGLCLSQRMGVMTACAYSAQQPESISSFAHGILSDQGTAAESSSANNNGQCSLSEQLLSKVWSQLEPMLTALLLLLSLWLLAPRVGWYCRLLPSPQPYAGRRRHLVLCVFRE